MNDRGDSETIGCGIVVLLFALLCAWASIQSQLKRIEDKLDGRQPPTAEAQ